MASSRSTIDIVIGTVCKFTGIDAAKRALKSLSTHVGNFTKTVATNLTNIKSGFEMIGGTVSRFAGVFTKSIKAAFDFEGAKTAFAGLLNSLDKSTKHVADLQKFASQTPLTFDDLKSASKLLLSFGMSVDDIMPSLKMLGDISMGDAQKFQGLALVFAQVKSAGKLMGQDLLQMINQGFNPLTVIAQKTGKSMTELKDIMAKGGISFEMVAEAMRLATSEGGLFNNAMEDASKTGNGLLSTLQDNWVDALRTFGNELMSVAKGGIQWCINKLHELKSSGAIKEWAEKSKTAIYSVVGAFEALGDSSSRSEVWSALKDVVVGGFELAANKAVEVLTKAAPIIGGLIASGFTNLKEVMADALTPAAARRAAEEQLGDSIYHTEEDYTIGSAGAMVKRQKRVLNAGAEEKINALAEQILEETRRQKAAEAKEEAANLAANYMPSGEGGETRFERGINTLKKFGERALKNVEQEAKQIAIKEAATGSTIDTTVKANPQALKALVAPVATEAAKSVKKELADSKSSAAKSKNTVEQAKTEFEKAFKMYRSEDHGASVIAEERDYAKDYKQLQKDARRSGRGWQIDELASLMAAGDTKGQADKLEEWRKSSRFTPEVESMVRAAAADQTKTTAEDELRKINENTRDLSKKLDELLSMK